MSEKVGTITWISGPVVRARGSRNIGMLELVEVGDEHLVGEVIGLDGDVITAQVYEETSGMQPGAPIFGTGLPLSVNLGPGLMQSIYDGVQRPLPLLEAATGSFIRRGTSFDPISREKKSVTKTVSSSSALSLSLVMATAHGLPPVSTVSTTVRVVVSMTDTEPDVWLATKRSLPFGVRAQPRGSVPTVISATTLKDGFWTSETTDTVPLAPLVT